MNLSATDRTTGQNAMYSPRYVRLKQEMALVLAVSPLPDGWSVPSLMPLGGESRLAGVEVIDKALAFPSAARTGDFMTVVSVTPARFSDPWWGAGPGEDASRLTSELAGQVATVVLDRPHLIGGWDSVKGEPLPLVPLVPPGTVWWIDSATKTIPGPLQLGEGIQTRYGNGLAFVSGSA
ncbi:MAG: type III-B CRISPR module-associated Cmr3 family protein [Planctomycetota bacterium]